MNISRLIWVHGLVTPLRLCYMHHWQCVAQTELNGRFWNPVGWLKHAERHLRAIFCINCEEYKVNLSEPLPSAIVSGSQLCLRYFSSEIHRQDRRKAVCCFLHYCFFYLEGFAVLPDISPRGAVYVPVQLGSVNIPPFPVRNRTTA